MQNIGQYIHLIVLGLFLLGGFFSWLSKTLKEQTQAKRLRDRREQAQAEQLRTGRTAVNDPVSSGFSDPSPEQSAQRRLQELADRRKRQLDELRARQAAANSGTVAQSAASPPPPIPAASRPAASAESRRLEAARRLERQRAEVARRREAAARLAAQLESERNESKAQARKDAQRDATRVEAARVSESITAAAFAQHSVASPVIAAAAVKGKAAPKPSTFGKLSLADLRKAILLQEILSPPVSARNPSSGGML